MTFFRTALSKKHIMSRSVILSALFAICSFPVFAQSSNIVTLRSGDGDGITGEVVELAETTIQIRTTVGSFTIPLAGVTCTGAACPDITREDSSSLPVIVLSARDGSAQFIGNLLEVVDQQYVLATEAGEVRFNVADVNCAGEACLSEQDAFQFGGPVTLASGAAAYEGILTGLDDNYYFVDVNVLGALRVSRDYACNGDGCPPN